jgi:PHD/YefM family antitoxin component YafN of YafNO toxin-antitoxin module
MQGKVRDVVAVSYTYARENLKSVIDKVIAAHQRHR